MIDLDWVGSLSDELVARSRKDPEQFIKSLQAMAEIGHIPNDEPVKTADNRIAEVGDDSALFLGESAV